MRYYLAYYYDIKPATSLLTGHEINVRKMYSLPVLRQLGDQRSPLRHSVIRHRYSSWPVRYTVTQEQTARQ